jgi:hypothetical protein
VVDYAEPDPDPPPLTTIGWRLVHLADCKVMYHEWAFGPRRLRAALAGLDDEQLDGPRWTNWGERWPAWRVLWTMIDHDAHHGGEIGCPRDLYRVTVGGP